MLCLRLFVVVSAWFLVLGAGGVPPVRSVHSAPVNSALFFDKPHFDDSTQTLETLARRNTVLFSASVAQIPILRGVNPEIKVLMYDLPGGSHEKAKDYAYLDSRTSWWVVDVSGHRMHETRGYGPYVTWLLNVGKSAYRDYESAMVANTMTRDDYDGVFLDVSHPTWVAFNEWYDPAGLLTFPPAIVVASWPDWMLAFHRQLQAMRGDKISIFNGWPNNPYRYIEYQYWYDETLAASAGAQFDGFCYNRTEPWSAKGWEFETEQVRKIAAADKIALLKAPLHLSRDDPRLNRLQRFCFSSYLLVADGRNVMYRNSDASDEAYWNDTLFTAPLGRPGGRAYAVGPAWRRDFGAGAVVVNPSDAAWTIDLGKTFYKLSGESVRYIRVPSLDGQLLLDSPP